MYCYSLKTMSRFFMFARAKRPFLSLFYLVITGLFPGAFQSICSAQGITLYTPYTRISVPPGQSIDYSIDVINNGGGVQNADIAVVGLPKGWTYDLKSGGWTLGQISVLKTEKKNFSLTVQVPFKVNKGVYHFQVLAKGKASLPLTVEVSAQGTFKTEFTTDQANMEGAANSTFTFNAKLRNSTADDQVYAFRSEAPEGWNVTFKANYKQVSSTNILANKTQDLTIEVDPPDETKAGTYKVPVIASTSNTSADLTLEVVVTGSYGVALTTPTGLLSTDLTAGDDKKIEFSVRNTGSAPLKNIELISSNPSNWTVTFEPAKIELLNPGATAQVYATVKADKKAIPGDYVCNLTAKTAETSSKAEYRVSIETSMIWGWIGILIIAAALYSVYYLFRKYGRR
ncbi:NPCBM-associated, NEW3 domain of alpha-galactosidase [bacterium A37T11]|nr:NPCBM-associated, NEW3 domain of alpha-galactosidase [bacterium A37T11]